jgi:uncharacterized integral membrane protein
MRHGVSDGRLGYAWPMSTDSQSPDRGTPDPAPEPESPPPPSPDPLRMSRTSGAWIAASLLALFLVLLIIFIVQNTQKVNVSFLGWDGQAPLAAALLIAAVAGLVTTGAAGALRILQLRRRVKRDRGAGR